MAKANGWEKETHTTRETLKIGEFTLVVDPQHDTYEVFAGKDIVMGGLRTSNKLKYVALRAFRDYLNGLMNQTNDEIVLYLHEEWPGK